MIPGRINIRATHLEMHGIKKERPEAFLMVAWKFCSNANKDRVRRHARRARSDFYGGKSHLPEEKSLLCRFHDRNPKDSSEIW